MSSYDPPFGSHLPNSSAGQPIRKRLSDLPHLRRSSGQEIGGRAQPDGLSDRSCSQPPPSPSLTWSCWQRVATAEGRRPGTRPGPWTYTRTVRQQRHLMGISTMSPSTTVPVTCRMRSSSRSLSSGAMVIIEL